MSSRAESGPTDEILSDGMVLHVIRQLCGAQLWLQQEGRGARTVGEACGVLVLRTSMTTQIQ